MWQMFSGCSSLTSLDVSSFDTGNVTSTWHMFSGCRSLTSVDVSGFDTGSVTDMGAMFSGCSSLRSVDVSSFDTGSVTGMYYMFSGCSSLRSVDVSGFDTGSVTDMRNMFLGCSSLTSLDVSSFDTGSVTDMGGMFQGCSSLRSVDVSGFDTGSVTGMYYMFSGCSSLTSVDVSSFDTGSVTSMEAMFSGCSSLTSLDVSGFDTGSITFMGWMFTNCRSLTSLDVSNFDTSSVTEMVSMFQGCSSLTSLDLSNFDTSSVRSMEQMFFGCSSLTSLDLSSFDTGSVTDIGNMFSGCTSLTTLHAPLNVNVQVLLPAVTGTVWQLPDGTEVTELPKGLTESILLTRVSKTGAPQITTTTTDLNMEDVIRVKYVPYYINLETDNTDPTNTVTFSIVEGRLADGLMLYPATGEIYGVPLEAGQFPITVQATYSNPAYLPATAKLMLTVLENTDDNVGAASDPGYDITQPVTDFAIGAAAGTGSQTLVSQGEYAQFQHKVYLDGRLLEEGEGKDYTSEEGSTRITIMNQTLSKNGEGSHTLGIEFRTEEGVLRRAAQNYTVSKSSTDTPSDKPDDTKPDKPGDKPDDTKPSTPTPGVTAPNAPAAAPAAAPAVTEEEKEPEYIIYTVGRGDTLWGIAARFCGNGNAWRRIYEDNRQIIRNPGRIYKGQKLIVYLTKRTTGPTAPGTQRESLEGSTYVVRKGDSLWTIARRAYGSGRLWKLIYEANKDIIADPERIRGGQTITIPER